MTEYFIICVDYGRKGRDLVGDPELTRRAVIDRLKDYQNIAWVHRIHDCTVEDVTNELLAEAGFFDTPEPEVDHRSIRFDHAHDTRKNWVDA